MSHPLVERLHSADPEERRAACLAVGEDPAAALLLDALAGALGDPERRVARAASDAFARAGRHEPQAQSVLRHALQSEDPRRRWGAAFTYARLAPPEPGLLPAVVEAMASPDGDVRWAAARLLVEIGRLHPEVLRIAIGLARGADSPAVRRMATFCLRELAPDDPHAAAALLEASRDPDLRLQRAAITALAALLDPPPEVIARLEEALRVESDPSLPRLAAIALGELGANTPGSLSQKTRQALESTADTTTDVDLRRAARRALERIERAET